MSKFIKLSNRIINTAHLVEIKHYFKRNNVPAYQIHLNKHNYSGWWAFTGGSFDTIDNTIEICSKTDFEDYRVVKEWIFREIDELNNKP
jgi:hypothetical protein